MNETERRRRERLLFLVLLLFGIGILLCVGQLAIKPASSWEVAANMRSNLDPNVDFLTRKNSGLIEPLNPDILTLPAWLNVLLTPNAVLPTSVGFTPPATRAPTRASTRSPTQPATLPPPTIVITVIPPTRKPPSPKTATPTLVPNSADLQITKTDGSPTYFAGGVVVYKIVVSNPSGPKNISGAIVTDTIPAQITSANWICVGAGGATCTHGAGNTYSLANLPVGSSVTYTIVGAISASASGNLVNSAHVSLPVGFSDPVPANNTATDSDALAIHRADLRIVKTDVPAVTTYPVGGSKTYRITVSNSGTTSVTGATVTDNFDFTRITSATWTCAPAGGATCAAAGSGNINELVNLPVGSSVTYMVNATISPSASGDLVNTASVNLPAGYGDTNPADNTSTNTDTPVANLSISKDDGIGNNTYIVGGSTIYTIVVSNSSPANVTGATVIDNFDFTRITNATWTCAPAGVATCAASGSGSINDLINLPVGSSVTYTVNATISPSASGDLVNTASVNLPVGFGDTNPLDNISTDTDTPIFSANLGITKDDSSTTYIVGGSTTYTIVVSNPLGPANVTSATVTDTFPAEIASATWTCVSAGGATCTAAGSGNINELVNLPVGSSITYTVIADIRSSASGNLDNIASVNLPAGFSAPLVYTATDTDTPVFNADLGITKDDGVNYLTAGESTTYTIVVSNSGPADVVGATVTDTFPAEITNANWTCVSAGGATCTASSSGNINELVNLPVGSSVTYTVNATISPLASGNLVNTASVSVPAGYTDSNPSNDSADDTDTISVPFPSGDIDSFPNDVTQKLLSGETITLTFGTPLVVNGSHAGYDLVYYEFVNGAGILLDNVVLQLGDGINWYTIFDWGSDPLNINPDTNTNIAIPLPVPPNPTDCSGEPDECRIDQSLLIDPTGTLPIPTGIGINVDGVIPNGTYYYIKIISPAGDGMGDGCEVDAIYVIP
jgi:uncharacterized repeat protein (TIGR01451 family)